MRLLLVITVMVNVPFISSSPLHRPDELMESSPKEVLTPSIDQISREASSEKHTRRLIKDDEQSETDPDAMKLSAKVESLKSGQELLTQRSTKQKQGHANLIPFHDLKFKHNQKIIYNAFSDKKKRTNMEAIRYKAHEINNYQINSHLPSKHLQISDDLQSIRPKYINDDVKSLPPFPELIYETMVHDPPNPNRESSISNQDDVLKRVRAMSLQRSTDSQPKTGINNTENENSNSSSISKFIEREKFILSPKTESIFQSEQLRRYERFEPILPFPELHVPAQLSRKNSEGKNVPHQVVNEGNVPERAGPELYPASVFEKDLHVPFY